jgi:glutamate N-acetyltransferase / amino-acid N-acetyltransferase
MAPRPSLSSVALKRLIKRRTPSQPSPAGVRHYSAPLDGTVPAAKQKYVPTSGTYPKGFLVSGTHVGVKPTNKSTPDLAFIASETPCAAASVFTKNKFQAAPVTVSREMLKRRNNAGVRAVIVNSGCANAVTGKGGMEDAEKMGLEADRCFEEPSDGKGSSTIVMSTGVIGQRWAFLFMFSSIG